MLLAWQGIALLHLWGILFESLFLDCFMLLTAGEVIISYPMLCHTQWVLLVGDIGMGWNSQPAYTQEVEKLTKRLAKSWCCCTTQKSLQCCNPDFFYLGMLTCCQWIAGQIARQWNVLSGLVADSNSMHT